MPHDSHQYVTCLAVLPAYIELKEVKFNLLTLSAHAREGNSNHFVTLSVRKARNHCQDVDKRGDEDHCQYHFGIDHCQTGNHCQGREHCQNGNEHSDR